MAWARESKRQAPPPSSPREVISLAARVHATERDVQPPATPYPVLTSATRRPIEYLGWPLAKPKVLAKEVWREFFFGSASQRCWLTVQLRCAVPLELLARSVIASQGSLS